MTSEEAKDVAEVIVRDANEAEGVRISHAFHNLLQSQTGRTVFAHLLDVTGFAKAASPSDTNMSYTAGVKSVGERLYAELLELSPELVFKLLAEREETSERLAEASTKADAARQAGQEDEDEDL